MQKNIPLFILSVGLYFLIPTHLFSQQLSTFTQYRELLTVINPAAIPPDYFVYGNEHKIFVGTTYRTQWRNSGLQSPPKTLIFNIDFIPEEVEYGGLFGGGFILHDRSGIFETTGIYGKLAGAINIGIGELSIGLNIGIVQNRLKFRTPTSAPPNNFAGISPDVGGGIFYRQDFPKQGFLYAGISVPQVFGLTNTFSTIYSVKRVQHYYGTVGLLSYFTENSFFEPSILAKFVSGAPPSLDLNIRLQLDDVLWLGTGISSGKAFHLNVGFLLNWENMLMKFGFGYSGSAENFGPALGGSQELHNSTAF